MTVVVTRRREDRRLACLSHRGEYMRVTRRQDSVDGYLNITQGAVLKTDGTGKTRRQLPMNLTSVVRAPIALQHTKSLMYWGVMIEILGTGT